VAEPDVADRYDVHMDLAERVPHPVHARTENALEHTVAEEQTALVLTNLETTNQDQVTPSLLENASGAGKPAATPRAWSAT
jgi:hypothetical protein